MHIIIRIPAGLLKNTLQQLKWVCRAAGNIFKEKTSVCSTARLQVMLIQLLLLDTVCSLHCFISIALQKYFKGAQAVCMHVKTHRLVLNKTGFIISERQRSCANRKKGGEWLEWLKLLLNTQEG